jgi:hypothetical protein
MFALSLLLAGVCLAETKLGKPLTLKQPMTGGDLMSKPGEYAGKTVQVKGKVTGVCQMMGCWMMIADESAGKAIRIKVEDGEIVIPKDAAGKSAIAEGKLVKIEQTKEQAIEAAKHEAEEQGRKFDPSTVQSGKTSYQIQGTGAVVLD